MTTKKFKYKTGLACMRVQPFHTGHQLLIDAMLSECEICYIFIGSAQESGTVRNPIPYLSRKRLIENFYAEEWSSGRLVTRPAEDINDLPNWSNYIVNQIDPVVDKYYAGSKYDAVAFTDYPPKNYPKIEVGVLDREDSPQLASGTDIRELFKKGNPTWKLFIPVGNVDITERVLNGKHPFPELEKLEEEMGGEML